MAFRPSTGALYLTENSWHQQDEVNLVVPGGDYGWPTVMGIANDPAYLDPIIEYTPSIAPTEADFYTGDAYLGAYRDNFFFGDFITGNLRRLVLGEDGQILFREALLAGEHGPIVDVVTGPDGLIYFSTPTAIFRITTLGP
jgi:quinoprotein glucose dehydrogenase